MLFENIKNSFVKSVQEAGSANDNNKQQPRIHRRIHRRLSNIYNSVFNIKNAFSAYSTIKAAYDPFQMKQYASESGFDPYCNDAPMNEEKFDIYHDAKDCFFDECLPAAKRIRIMAASAIDSAAHSFAWGAMAAAHYMYTSVPIANHPPNGFIPATPTDDTATANNTTDFAGIMNNDHPNNNYKKKKETVSMRGFGVDFAAVVERSPEMKKSMESVERHVRVICLEANVAAKQEADFKRMALCGGSERTSLKRSIEDSWGFIEKDYSINFKVTYLCLSR